MPDSAAEPAVAAGPAQSRTARPPAYWSVAPADDVLRQLGSRASGLTTAEAAERLAADGPNAVRTHHAQWPAVLGRQLRNPLLLLLLGTAAVSGLTGQHVDAAIIAVIVSVSVGLGFVDEFRSERAVEAMHDALRHSAWVRRDDAWSRVDVTTLVVGDVVRLGVGDVVPADVRLLDVRDLSIDESVLTGEPEPREKTAEPAPEAALLDVPSCALMGTVVRTGAGSGVVVGTGGGTAFGGIALALGERQAETAFQRGLRDFSRMLVGVAAALSLTILVVNIALGRGVLTSLLFALAIAIGLTPQLLPAIVTVSLATGVRRLTAEGVLVKRLVSIEDLGNVRLLLTDKTGTLTEGRIAFVGAVSPTGEPDDEVVRWALMTDPGAGEAAGASALDQALRDAPVAATVDRAGVVRLDFVPFDHDRRLASALVDATDGRRLVVKGAPESVLARCTDLPPTARPVLDGLFRQGRRVLAVATRPMPGATSCSAADERGLRLEGLLVFADPVRADAAAALERLRRLEVDVKIITGDNGVVAQTVCAQVGMRAGDTIDGAALDALDDAALSAQLPATTVFARVSPEQKARIVRVARLHGADVGFLGDGANDAVALHEADVGISVDGAAEVAKDAADVVLLRHALDVLADGVVGGRRIFANTVKYVLMGTSSNFGNMISAAGASLVLPFLPLLPTQVLLNNLLYDAGQLPIPSDRVDEEMLRRPAGWDVGLIRRYMAVFGPISSLFDVLMFVVLLRAFHAGPELFRSGWFVESLATQTLVVHVIRTRRTPFFRSRPGTALLVTTLAVVAAAFAIPWLPFAGDLGFVPLPASLVATIVGFIVAYLALVEAAKVWFFAHEERLAARAPRISALPAAVAVTGRQRRVHRRAARFSHRGKLNNG